MTKIWNFPPSNHVQNQGSAGGGTDQFSGSPLNNLAREIIQNSLDARMGEKPVVVEFHKFKTLAEDFPGIESLFQYVLALYNQYKNNPGSDSKDIAVIKNFIESLKNKEISWLRISDFNTTGLWGSSTPSNQSTPWFAFIKGAGKNQKSDKSGGSKGLGKNAIYANSILRTMLVSTLTKNPSTGNEERASIGISKMLSLTLFEEDSGNPDWTQGIGFCVENQAEAKKYNSPSFELMQLDPEFDREALGYGTDIYVPCFPNDNEWDDIMAIESILSFLPAIIDGDLRIVFTYDDTNVVREINSYTIAKELIGKSKNKKEAKAVYEVLTSNQTKKIPYTAIPGFEMTLMLLQNNLEGLNCVYEYRLPTKMKIQSENKDANVQYTGVLLIQGSEICKRLRSIEDATHSRWSVFRYKDSGYTKKEIEEALHVLDTFLTNQCRMFGSSEGSETVFLEVKGWDTEEDPFDMSIGEQTEIGLPTEEITFNMKLDSVKNPKRKPFKKKGNIIDDSGSAETNLLDIGTPGEGDKDITHPDGLNKGKGGDLHPGQKEDKYNPEVGDNLVAARRRIATINARMPSICPEDGIFDLVFVSEKTGTDAHIEILKSGIDGENETVDIKSALYNSENLVIENNKLLMGRIEKGVEYRIHLKIGESTNYVWEVNVDAED